MKTIKISLPDTWNSLTERQLEKMALLFSTRKVDRLFHLQVFMILADVRWWQLRKAWQIHRVLKDVPVSELRSHYQVFYTALDRTVFPEYMVTKKEAFFSPMPRLTNLSIEEFAMAEDLHRMWHKDRDRNALEYLAAVLYTTAPNIRPPFEKMELGKKAELFKTVPMQKLLAMELAYFGSKNYIASRFPRAFPKSVAITPKKGKQYGFGKVILNMAGGKFGHHESTRRTNLYTFLEEFEETLRIK